MKNEDDELAAARDTARDRPRFNRLLVPGGLISSRRGMVEPTGQVERETIEEYIEE